MAAGNPCQPEPTTETTNGSRKSLSARTNNPKNKLLYLECQWKPHKSIIVELKLSKSKIYNLGTKCITGLNSSESQEQLKSPGLD